MQFDAILHKKCNDSRNGERNPYAVGQLHGMDVYKRSYNKYGDSYPCDKGLKAYTEQVKRKNKQGAAKEFYNRVNGTDGFPASPAAAPQKKKTEYGHKIDCAQGRPAFRAHGTAFCNGQLAGDPVNAYV